jgi:hypothetical protein
MESFPPERLRVAFLRAIVSQPELARYLIDETRSLDPKMYDRALPLFVMLLRMFEKSAGGDFAPVSAEDVAEAERLRDALIEDCDPEDEQVINALRKNLYRGQPNIMYFLNRTLAPRKFDPDVIEPEEEDNACLFFALVTVVIALDLALNPAEKAAR